jgi:hypothetical protein
MIKSEATNIFLHPLESYTRDKYTTIDEKNDLLDLIIDDIKEWKDACSQLDREDNYLGSFCITKCPTCYQWYLKMCELYSEENNGDSMKWSYFFSEYEKFNYTCGLESCKLTSLDDNLKNEYNDKQHNRKNMLKKVQELQIDYRVALEQQKNLSKQLNDSIQVYKEKNAVLIFKKKSLQYVINSIQISIIIVSSVITLFEAIQGTVLKNVMANATDVESFPFIIFPIVCSSYIGLVLAIGRFFKFDTKNEQIIKLIEKYSFIINKLRQKRSKYMDFDFKIHDVAEWKKTLSILEKDSLDDIIMKANEECDLILTPNQYTHYKKKYTKTRMKDLLERKNYDELTDIIIHNSESTDQKDITLNMIKKRNFCKYYFCFQWLCFDRDYLDYGTVLVQNREKFYCTEKYQGENETSTRKKKGRAGRMRTLASNLLTLKRDFRNYSVDSGKSLPQNELISTNNEKKSTPDSLREDKLGDLVNFKSKIKNRRKKSKSFRDSTYDTNSVAKKFRKEKVKRGRGLRRNSFNRDENSSIDCNAWLHMQKHKNTEELSRLSETHDFSKINDLSRNKIFKNDSNNSNESSNNEAENVVLAIGNIDTNTNQNDTEKQDTEETKQSNESEQSE